MARIIASADDYRTYTGDDSADPTDRQLAAAAALVLRVTRHAVYTVGGDGKAVDSKIEQALRDATCEVLKHRDQAGVLSDVTLADLGVQSASLGSSSYTLMPGGAARTYRALPYDAELILEAAGLVRGPVAIVG